MANDYIIKIEGSWPSGETEYVIGTEDPQRLPMVSSDDNGDVLTVVDGKWSDAAPGGGGGGGGGVFPVVITQTVTPGNPPTVSFSADKTFAEIVAAKEAGQLVSVSVVNGPNTFSTGVSFFESAIVCEFFQTAGNTSMAYATITLDSTDAITYHAYTWTVSQIS